MAVKDQFDHRTFVVAGGVAANKTLRARPKARHHGFHFFAAHALNTDKQP
jgi:tRNA A37 threonylcarbamoyltransferase TsaD